MAEAAVQCSRLFSLIEQYGQKNKKFCIAKQPIMVEASGGDISYIDIGSRVSRDGSNSRVRLVTWRRESDPNGTADVAPTLEEFSTTLHEVGGQKRPVVQHDRYTLPEQWTKAAIERTWVDPQDNRMLRKETVSRALVSARPTPATPLAHFVVRALHAGMCLSLFASPAFCDYDKFPPLTSTVGILGPLFVGSAIDFMHGVYSSMVGRPNGHMAKWGVTAGLIAAGTCALDISLAHVSPHLGTAVKAAAVVGSLAYSWHYFHRREWSPYNGMASQPDQALETGHGLHDAKQRALYTRLDTVVQRGSADKAFGKLSVDEAREKLEKASLGRFVLGTPPHQAVNQSFQELTRPALEPDHGKLVHTAGELKIGGVRVPMKLG